MARGRSYKMGVFDATAGWTVTGGANAGNTSVPMLYWTGATTQLANIFNISVGVMGVGTIPSNASVTWSINAATGTRANGLAVTPVQIAGAALASTAVVTPFTSGAGATAISGISATTSYWDRVTPFAAGANWEDIVTYGDEISLPGAATGYGLFVTPTGTGAGSTTFFAEIEWSE